MVLVVKVAVNIPGRHHQHNQSSIFVYRCHYILTVAPLLPVPERRNTRREPSVKSTFGIFDKYQTVIIAFPVVVREGNNYDNDNHHPKLTHPYPLFCSLATIHRINVREVVCGPNLVVEIIIFIVKKNNSNILIPFNTNLAVKTTIVLIININNIFILFMDSN